MAFRGIVLLTVISSLLLGCSENSKSPNPDLVRYDIKLAVDSEKVTDKAALAMAESINAGQAVSHKLVNSFYQNFHTHAYVAEKGTGTIQPEEVPKFVDTISAGLAGSNYFVRKDKYEAKIAEMFGQDPPYNKDAASVAHILKQQRLQCYSGTSLSLMVSRAIEAGRDFENNNYVTVFEAGHVLPGKMIQYEGQWRLIGVESTMLGAATKDYGFAKDLNRDQVRVVDSSLFVLVEIFKSALSDPAKTSNEAMITTAKKYGIDLNKMSPGTGAAVAGQSDSKCSVDTVFGSSSNLERDYSLSSINTSPFGFGCSNVKKGDKTRHRTKGIGVDFSNGGLVDLEQLIAGKIVPTPIGIRQIVPEEQEMMLKLHQYGESENRISEVLARNYPNATNALMMGQGNLNNTHPEMGFMQLMEAFYQEMPLEADPIIFFTQLRDGFIQDRKFLSSGNPGSAHGKLYFGDYSHPLVVLKMEYGFEVSLKTQNGLEVYFNLASAYNEEELKEIWAHEELSHSVCYVLTSKENMAEEQLSHPQNQRIRENCDIVNIDKTEVIDQPSQFNGNNSGVDQVPIITDPDPADQADPSS